MNQCKKLEHLCRYITRPDIANERLKLNRADEVVLQLKSTYKDGTTHIVMTTLGFMQRPAALDPRQRLNLIRFHGLPPARLRNSSKPIKQTFAYFARSTGLGRLLTVRLLVRVCDH